ncbi:MAG: YebC/PmpR family DNA-binding transcriptional regulator [Ruminococcaceae bacterium]|nr:YebC/PmpR family DNA-binding transcriptional regulator [Oscillospiraceae bacterium]
MSGHSKWKNIMHKKEKTDAQRAKVFTKIGKEIAIAVRDGGPEPTSNTRLRDLIAKAKSLNVPNDNIDRVIKKASGADSVQYEVLTYEGYGPGGVAIIVDAATDNRNRTAGEVRHYFDKFGGNLGTSGCVSYLFADKGVVVVSGVEDEDAFMEACMDCGALDFTSEDGHGEVFTDVSELSSVREALEAKGYTIESADPEKVPSNYVRLDDEDQIVKMNRLLEALEDNDDVTEVWHNWDDGE